MTPVFGHCRLGLTDLHSHPTHLFSPLSPRSPGTGLREQDVATVALWPGQLQAEGLGSPFNKALDALSECLNC